MLTTSGVTVPVKSNGHPGTICGGGRPGGTGRRQGGEGGGGGICGPDCKTYSSRGPDLVKDKGDEQRNGGAVILQDAVIDAHKHGVEHNPALQEDGCHCQVSLQ